MKRFTETISTGIVTDNLTGKEYNCEYRIDDELLKLLNALNDENEQLNLKIDGLEYALKNIKRIDVEVDLND